MDEGVVLEVPGTNLALLVVMLDQGVKLLERPAVNLPGIGPAIPYITPMDAASQHLREMGYAYVRSVVVEDHVIEFFTKEGSA